jgi:hypothetical protein
MAKHSFGFITGSTVSAILTGKGEKLLTGGVNFAEALGAERSGVLDKEMAKDSHFQGNYATEWGNEHEAEALEFFSEKFFANVTDLQKSFIDESNWLSCTVDAMWHSNVLEVKCPANYDNHRKHLLNPESFLKEHETQLRFNMMLSGAERAYLISYDPRYVGDCRMLVIEIEQCKQWEIDCMNRVKQANEIAEETAKDLQNYKLTIQKLKQ